MLLSVGYATKINANNLQFVKYFTGKLLTINKNHEPELFWALRGGGGGGLSVIITEFKFRLIKSPSLVTTFDSIWDENVTN